MTPENKSIPLSFDDLLEGALRNDPDFLAKVEIARRAAEELKESARREPEKRADWKPTGIVVYVQAIDCSRCGEHWEVPTSDILVRFEDRNAHFSAWETRSSQADALRAQGLELKTLADRRHPHRTTHGCHLCLGAGGAAGAAIPQEDQK